MISQGKEVRVWKDIATQRLEIHKGELAAGSYVVSVLENGSEYSLKLIVE